MNPTLDLSGGRQTCTSREIFRRFTICKIGPLPPVVVPTASVHNLLIPHVPLEHGLGGHGGGVLPPILTRLATECLERIISTIQYTSVDIPLAIYF